ncbi:hypothetical protein MLD38_000155 [Melastoma candidum]|uniref:Uncharacterized protein n=1 Tax=Melastoma candidum TaxID=119954 RepID=A0ACB9S8Y1_9MYRT|nr:hypothetical protein MLD38_000155 [Melastoma candidum]
MEHTLEKKYPLNAKDYKLYEEVGEGVSATVYRALCIPFNEIVAVKVLDLEKCNNDLDGIRREVQTMSLIGHPNLLRAHCSFTAGHSLWVVMPYMEGGSCLHIMKSAFPEGFEEPVIATLLHEVLKALVYLHAHGHIHRDVKSGNILVSSNGVVKLADFGVSACMFDTGDRQRSRNTFVGTPCWMAPEVMQQLQGYDFKADIWSFGITALELAHGHAPFSKYPPMKVLLMTLQNAPPGLDYERDKRFSKSFKEMVATCLVKDPKKRPTSEKLLKHPFFKRARSSNYLAKTILEGLVPLGDRFRALKAKEAALLLQNNSPHEDKEHLSQQEYIRGISAWDFNLEDLKSQAALIQDDDVAPNTTDAVPGNDIELLPKERQFSGKTNKHLLEPKQEVAMNALPGFEESLTSFLIKPVKALRGYFDLSEVDVTTSVSEGGSRSDHEEQLQTQPVAQSTKNEAEHNGPDGALQINNSLSSQGHLENQPVSKWPISEGDRSNIQSKHQSEHNSGQILHRLRREPNNLSSAYDSSEGGMVQHKGRFKAHGSLTFQDLAAGTLLPSLQYILQQNSMQREEILKLIKYAEQISGKQVDTSEGGMDENIQASATPREKELQSQLRILQQRIDDLVEKLQSQRLKNTRLEQQMLLLVKQRKRSTEETEA